MDKTEHMRTIEVLLFEGANLLDIAGPAQVFETARLKGELQYNLRFVSLGKSSVRTCCGLKLVADDTLAVTSESDDLLIPGGKGVNALLGNELLLSTVRARSGRSGSGRLISVCSGALVLAQAGVLDGKRATTHWSRSDDTQKYSDVLWDLDQISISEERIFTSAGVTTGIDLALAIVRKDCGPDAAMSVARELVVQLRRTGGQSQYAIYLAGQFTQDDALARLIEAVVTRPNLDWSLVALAHEAGLNTRTLSRHFKRDLQMTPAQFVEHTRVDHARGMLSEKVPLKQVAYESGFGDLQRMRRAFKRRFGIHVSDYLNAFG